LRIWRRVFEEVDMIRHLSQRFLGDSRGAAAVEYGLLLGLMVIAIVGAVTAVGSSTSENFNSVNDGFS
jgi:pilus assembly protein Flp/PilA